ncbi:hypothetical protein BDW71DRAFT_190780 [Aspergillus fruticulosus]
MSSVALALENQPNFPTYPRRMTSFELPWRHLFRGLLRGIQHDAALRWRRPRLDCTCLAWSPAPAYSPWSSLSSGAGKALSEFRTCVPSMTSGPSHDGSNNTSRVHVGQTSSSTPCSPVSLSPGFGRGQDGNVSQSSNRHNSVLNNHAQYWVQPMLADMEYISFIQSLNCFGVFGLRISMARGY